MTTERPDTGPEDTGPEGAGPEGAGPPHPGPPGVVVRTARPGDAPAIARLEGLSASTRRALDRDLRRAAAVDADLVALIAEPGTDHLDARAADDDRAPRGAETPATGHLDARVAGPAAAVGAALGQVLVDEGHVLDLAVEPALRGRGIGRLLLDRLLAELTQRGARAHTLEVRPGNLAALAVYRAAGFAVEGRRPRYYPDGDDALLLWRREQERRV